MIGTPNLCMHQVSAGLNAGVLVMIEKPVVMSTLEDFEQKMQAENSMQPSI